MSVMSENAGGTAVLMNGNVENTPATELKSSSPKGLQKKLESVGAIKETEQLPLNGIEKCGVSELPDLDAVGATETNGNHSTEEVNCESILPIKQQNDMDNLKKLCSDKNSTDVNVEKNEVDAEENSSISETNSSQLSQNEETKSDSERSDNIFEKFNHPKGNENGTTSENDKIDIEPSKCPLTLQMKSRESFRGLIKAAASKVGSQTSVVNANSLDPVNEKCDALAEQCGDVTSTSKVEQTVLPNADKGNLFENLTKGESPISVTGLDQPLVSQEQSHDDSEFVKEPALEKNTECVQNELPTAKSDELTESSIVKHIEGEQIKDCLQLSASEETLLRTNNLLDSDLNDILLDKEDDDNILSEDVSETQNNVETKDATSIPELQSDCTVKDGGSLVLKDTLDHSNETDMVLDNSDHDKVTADTDIKHKSLSTEKCNIESEEVMDTEDTATKQSENEPITSTEEINSDTSVLLLEEGIPSNDITNSQLSNENVNHEKEKSMDEGLGSDKLTAKQNKSSDVIAISSPKTHNDGDDFETNEHSTAIKEDVLLTKSDSTTDNSVDKAKSNSSEGGEVMDMCETRIEETVLQDLEIDTDHNSKGANGDMDIDTDLELKLTTEMKDDIVKVDSDIKDSKMDTDTIVNTKQKTETKSENQDNDLAELKDENSLKSEGELVSEGDFLKQEFEEPKVELKRSESPECPNIVAESRKRAAASPMIKGGTGKKSRLENVVGGLMTRLGKEMNLEKETCFSSDDSSETELQTQTGPYKEMTVKKLQCLMRRQLKMTIEKHQSAATIIQLQKRLVSLQAEMESWKSTAQVLEEQVRELTKSSARQEKRRARNSVTQADEGKIKATAQGLASSVKPPNGVVSPTNSQQTVVVGGKVVTATSPGATGPPGNVQAKAAAAAALDKRYVTVREMLDEKRGVITTKTAASHQTSTTTSTTIITSVKPSGGGGGGSMVVDLTEDDDPNSPSKSTTHTASNALALKNMSGTPRPIIPAAALPPGIRPGTYLLQQNAGGGTVLQQLMTPTQANQQQGHKVVIGTQGGPAVLLQTPPGVSTAGGGTNPGGTIIRQLNPPLSQQKGRGGAQVLVRQPSGVGTRPLPPLHSAPGMTTTRPPLSPTKKTTARKRTAPTTVRGNKKRLSEGGGDSSPDCDVMITTVTKPATAKCHPAPLPPQPTSQASGNGMRLLPPKPTLKISRVSQGIVLSWNVLTLSDKFEEIVNYQLFAYQEGSAPPSALLWKKVGDVKALPLPMACTLTQFQEGNRYHFSVRAMDKHQRVGPFSDPSSIHLAGKS